MNRTSFVNKLSACLSYPEDKCVIINNILEENFFISKKSKGKIVQELMNKLNICEEEALNIYGASVKLVNDEVKNKIKHPFKNKD